ncbi:hypothetical protein LSCM1_05426 [Leishmania martiniquensis]|uniref:mRNA 5'-phosphatase n=1 Tax=Leishmania martiniquensis TaxID=1580590 RepID=A0A836HHS3_9TRYP|nr:hypothetical protein LSCM1_05426 [Leishmania martiniquensis]
MSALRNLPPQEETDAQAWATPVVPALKTAGAAAVAPEAGPAATTETTAETASMSPCHGEVSSHPQPSPEVVSSLLGSLKPFLLESQIEIEARLCCLDWVKEDACKSTQKVPVGATVKTIHSDDTPRIFEGERRRIQIGVSAEDFIRMKAYVEEEKALPLQQTVTEDVNTQSGRYTYSIAEDGSETFTGCIKKRRLRNVEVLVPGCPYDIRVSVSSEVPTVSTTAPAVKPKGHVRRKRRWTGTDGTFEYALTRVSAGDSQPPDFEVEVEGVLADGEAAVTKAWLAELLSRLLSLAWLKDNTGLLKKPLPEGNDGKRSR